MNGADLWLVAAAVVGWLLAIALYARTQDLRDMLATTLDAYNRERHAHRRLRNQRHAE